MESTEKKRFVVATRDFSGLGFAKLISDAGYEVVLAALLLEDLEPEHRANYLDVGKDIVRKASFTKMFAARDKFKDWYWFFDQNNLNEYAQQLMDEGFKVWSGSELAGKMEHDRHFGIELAERAGLASPDEHEFTMLGEGCALLDANPDKAYVFKPNESDGTWETYVPDSEKDAAANRELYTYLEALPEGNLGGYILQERKKGVEANFEVWVHKGVPFFAWCDLECKKKLNDDMGPLVGGAQDIAFTVPIESLGVQETCAKLLELEEFKDYSGYLDMNVIIAEKENYFLEFCARTGYPAHPTLYSTLAKDPFPEILADMIDGSVEEFYRHFKHGFGAGITLYSDKNKHGMPLYVSEEVDHLFFPYDSTMRDDAMLTCGAGKDIEVGVITGHGYTLKQAAEEALANMRKVNFPNRSARTDLDRNCYPSSPQGRYDALLAMRYI